MKTKEINRLIQNRTCKVVTSESEGTGYLHGNPSQGDLFTSFHLVGSMASPYRFQLFELFSKDIEGPSSILPSQLCEELAIKVLLMDNDYLDRDNLQPTQKLLKTEIGEIQLEVNPYDGGYINCSKRSSDIFKIHIRFTRNYLISVAEENDIQIKIINLFKTKPLIDKIVSDHDMAKLFTLLGNECISFPQGCGYFTSQSKTFLKPGKLLSTDFAVTGDDKNPLASKLITKTKNYTVNFLINAQKLREYINQNRISLLEAALKDIRDSLMKPVQPIVYNEEVEIHLDNQIYYGQVYYPESKNRSQLLCNYAHLDVVPIKMTHLVNGAAIQFEKSPSILEKIDLVKMPSIQDIEIGETVYFGGYPINQETYSFSKGMIAAIEPGTLTTKYVIQAPIVSGNSGSFVFMQKDGQLCCVGMLTSEVAYFTEEMRFINKNLSRMDGISMSIGNVGLIESFREISQTLVNNLSTGKGRAIAMEDIEKFLFDETYFNQDVVTLSMEFLVGRISELKFEKQLFLFEYLNKIINESGSRIYLKHLFYFMKQYADIPTRQTIYGEFSNIDMDNGAFFIDLNFGELKKDISWEEIPMNCKNAANHDLKKMYKVAYEVSRGIIRNNQYSFVNRLIKPSKTKGHEFMTRKFERDHLGGSTNKERQKIARKKIKERAVTISTMMTDQSTNVEGLGNEIAPISRQNFFEHTEKTLSQDLSKNRQRLVGLFFQTNNQYSLLSVDREGNENKETNTFFYSVVRLKPKNAKKEGYYLHHFAGLAAEDQWVKKDIEYKGEDEKIKKTVYYTHN